MRYSVGAGIRWFSPMGPLRLEWGFNLDPTEDEADSQFEFSIGRFY
jgi:outer membrane protein insertion porin family